ncbi:MAG: hypothetical protein NT001_06035 [Candidatus Woesearchaeota archaeon]|nr:hypothetical protein [Candidatus Woesearchaeota archaeon]
MFYLFQGKILKYRYAEGKSYTKWHFRKRYPDARIESFYGSAFLKFMTKRYNKEWAERFERWLKGFGLFLWVEITKK